MPRPLVTVADTAAHLEQRYRASIAEIDAMPYDALRPPVIFDTLTNAPMTTAAVSDMLEQARQRDYPPYAEPMERCIFVSREFPFEVLESAVDTLVEQYKKTVWTEAGGVAARRRHATRIEFNLESDDVSNEYQIVVKQWLNV